MYQVSFYVPETHLESVKTAMFDAGGGRYEHYERCAWQILGQGQFQPLASSQPFLGAKNRLTYEAEYKVEMICSENCLAAVVQALKTAHPYEQPAYAVVKILQ